jgi:phosphoglycolate phosphatase-like HAD superfamily hydrolase
VAVVVHDAANEAGGRAAALARCETIARMTPPTLVLWDIDRTLVYVGEVSREIYARAFQEVTGQPLRTFADMTGRTDKAILTDTLAINGVALPEERFELFYAALARAAEASRERMRERGHRLPGGKEAIEALARAGAVQTVVTGNIRPTAIVKLDAFDLLEHLDVEVGGYGSDDRVRAALVRRARERAEARYGRVFERVVVIGDTPHDVQAARDAGVGVVAVATGRSGQDELVAAGAAVVLPDLTDTEAVLEAIAASATTSEAAP